jgi:branched-chain amino acid transport system permease protein
MGVMVGMKSFVIVILGGLGSIPGAIVGGFILGMIEALGGGYFSAAYKDVYGFGALVLILAFRPTGLFGKEITTR